MSRYLIVDTEKLSARTIAAINAVVMLKNGGVILTPEATETVFKDIWDNGFRCGDSDDWSDKTRKAIDEKWEELKKTL